MIFFPLSSVQREIWYEQTLYPDTPIYNIGGYFQFKGAVDVERLRQAIRLLVQETEALRLRIALREEGPTQTSIPMPDYEVELCDLSRESQPQAAALAHMQVDMGRPFKVTEEALFRYRIYRLSDELHLWFFGYHHLVIDGYASSLALQRVVELYTALRNGGEFPPSRGAAYAEFVASDAAYLDSELFDRDADFWRKRFASPPEPFWAKRPEYAGNDQIVPGATQTVFVSRERFSRLEALAKAKGSTVFHALVGLFSLTLTRSYDCDDCVIGLPVLNRSGAAFKQTIGLFASVIPARFNNGEGDSFSSLITGIGRTLREQYRHQRLPLSEIGRQSKLHESGRRRLFDAVLSYDRHIPSTMEGCRVRTTALANGFEQMPLSLYIGDYSADEDVQLDFSHNLAFLGVEETRSLAQRFLLLLDEALNRAETPVREYEILSAHEKQQLLLGWQAAPAPSSEVCVHQRIEQQAARNPEALALVSEDGGLSYGELNRRANRLAWHLCSLGLQPEDRVAVLLPRSSGVIVALLAVLKAGGAFVPLDPEHPEERLALLIQDSGARYLVTEESLRLRTPANCAVIVCPEGDRSAIELRSGDDLNRQLSPGQLAYVISTSGSTGRPKGVAVEHSALARHCLNIEAAYELSVEDRVLQYASMSFDTAFEQVFPTLCIGATLVLPASGLIGADRLDACLRQHQVTVADIPPALFPLWCEAFTPPLPPGLRLIILGGEALCSKALILRSRWPRPWPRMINAYGPSEATITATIHDIPMDHERTIVPIGRPLPGRKIHVLDRQLRLVPSGFPGELYIGGEGLARGYLGQAQLTAERFLPDPFSSLQGARLYRTGDLVRHRGDGALEFLGRVDRQVKIRGFRIEPGEIEALLKEREDVEEAVLTVEEGASLAAHVVLRGHRMREGEHQYELLTVAQQPLLEHRMEREHSLVWPSFFAGDRTQARYWRRLYDVFPKLQIALLEQGQMAAVGNMVPCHWDGSPESLPAGWDEVLEQAFEDQPKGYKANAVCVMAGVITSAYQGRRLSYLMIAAMAKTAKALGYDRVIVPVRPTLKSQYPHVPLREYATLRKEGGDDIFDPWLRVHHRLGGRVLGCSEKSQKVQGTVAQWRTWTGLEMRESGEYLVEGALQPVHIDLEKDIGLYHDQAVWVEHKISNFDGIPPSLTTAQELRSYLKARLPVYMVPSQVRLLAELPLTPNGKIDRKALAAHTRAGSINAPDLAARDMVEATVSSLWAHCLNRPIPGLDGNFFEMGGHSLVATQLASKLHAALGISVPVHWIFEDPTVRELAGRIRASLELAPPNSESHSAPANLIRPGSSRITPDMVPMVELTQDEIDSIVATVEGGAANVEDIYPLAPLQEGILFHHQLQAQGDSYVSQALLSFDTYSRLQSFITAFQAVVDRHDVLRTAFVWEGLSKPVQVVWRKAQLPVEVRRLDPACGSFVSQLLEIYDPRRLQLDLNKAPLRRLIVVEDAGCWLLLLLAHHLNEDHTSLGVLMSEIEAHLQGGLSQLPPPVPFREFVHLSRRKDFAEEHEAFFRSFLSEVDGPTAPFGLLNVHGDGNSASEARSELPAELSQRIRAIAQQLGLTPAALFHLAWALVLSRLCNQERIVFGTVLFGRMQGGKEIERAFGLFMNTLPFRIDCNERSVISAAKDTQLALLGLLHHEHAMLGLAQRCSALPASTPLFSSLLNYRYTPEEGVLCLEGVSLLAAKERCNYPIGLNVDDMGTGFALLSQVEGSLDPARICAYMHCALESLTQALEEQPQMSLCRLEILPIEEKRKLLEDWGGLVRPQTTSCAHELIEEQVARTPEATALVCDAEHLSYASLNKRANRLAHHLLALGVETDHRIALFLPRGSSMIVAILAVLKSGAAYVPLDPDYPDERLHYMFKDSGAGILITEQLLRGRMPADAGRVICLDTELHALSANREDNPKRQVLPVHLAYIIYTSGSTGRPKGVAVEHRGLGNLALEMIRLQELSPSSRVFGFFSFCFDASVVEYLMSLVSGASLHLPLGEPRFPGYAMLDYLKAARITHLIATPSALAILPCEPLPDLECVGVGGESCHGALASRWGQGRRFFNFYGPTEASVCASAALFIPGEDSASTCMPIGHPLRNVRLYVTNRQLQLVPTGVAGELCIGGIGVGRGYFGNTELTGERFVNDPFSRAPGSRLFRSGDLVRHRPGGELEFLGRLDRQVKLRGFRIELGEIEHALHSHPEVAEACVIVTDGADRSSQLVAYVVGRTEGLESSVLIDYLGPLLPHYMIPSEIQVLSAMPLTANGKLDRAAIASAPQDVRTEEGGASDEGPKPRSELEARMLQVWASLFPAKAVSVNDDFFDLGGHSLLVMRLISELKRGLGLQVAPGKIYEHPTISSLATNLSAQGNGRLLPSMLEFRAGGSRPALFFVPGGDGSPERLIPLAQALDPEQPFHIFDASKVNGQGRRCENVEELAEAFVAQLRHSQPQGPYYLGGYCLGGIVAYAAARMLLEQDERIALLVLVDSVAPHHIPSLFHTIDQHDDDLLLEVWQISEYAPLVSISEIQELPVNKRMGFIAQRLEESGVMPDGGGLDYLRSCLDYCRSTLRVSETLIQGSGHPLPVVLYKASEQMAGQEAIGVLPDDLGWGSHSALPVSIESVAGSHLSMIKSPENRQLAVSLGTRLSQQV